MEGEDWDVFLGVFLKQVALGCFASIGSFLKCLITFLSAIFQLCVYFSFGLFFFL